MRFWYQCDSPADRAAVGPSWRHAAVLEVCVEVRVLVGEFLTALEAAAGMNGGVDVVHLTLHGGPRQSIYTDSSL